MKQSIRYLQPIARSLTHSTANPDPVVIALPMAPWEKSSDELLKNSEELLAHRKDIIDKRDGRKRKKPARRYIV